MRREIITALERTERPETDFWFANLYNLAINLRNQGRLEESEELFSQAVVGTQNGPGSRASANLVQHVGFF